MPYLEVKSSVPIALRQQERIHDLVRNALDELMPGKNIGSNWLMSNYFGNCKMTFSKTPHLPVAFVELRHLDDPAPLTYPKAELTKAITEAVSTVLSIPPEQIYVTFYRTEYWGWDGKMIRLQDLP